jgi:hypothetical protein
LNWAITVTLPFICTKHSLAEPQPNVGVPAGKTAQPMNSEPTGAFDCSPMNGCGGAPKGTVSVQTFPSPGGGVVQLIAFGVPRPGPEICVTVPLPPPLN